MYHDGNRSLQDRFDSRRIADRLVDVLHRVRFTSEDREFIESRSMFFLATADADGWPDCSYKGGRPGFVRVIEDDAIAFPSYDGNGMFKSLGNLLANPRVGMLFMDFAQPKRLRVNGTCVDRFLGPAARQLRRGAARDPGARGAHLPELPSIHPSHGTGGDFGLCAGRRARGAGPRVERNGIVSRVPAAAAGPTIRQWTKAPRRSRLRQ